MSKLQKIAAALLVALLIVTGYGLWATNPAPIHVPPSHAAAAPAAGDTGVPVIDQNTLLTAQRLARLANTPEEHALAQSAVEIADHELDLAFTAALVHLEAHPPSLSPEATQIQERLRDAERTLASDAASVKQLNSQLATAAEADKPAIQDRLDLAQSRMELAQDEVQEANEDLLQAGGNVHQRIQRMQQEHESVHRNELRSAAPVAAGTLGSLRGMVGAMRRWLNLRDRQRSLREAQQQVGATATQLAAERQQMAADLAASKADVPELASRAVRPANTTAPAGAQSKGNSNSSAAATSQGGSALLGVTRQIAADQHRLTLRDQRIAARRRLADIYGQWAALIATQQRAVLHGCLQSAAIVLAALLLLLFADRWLERLLGRARV
ncbi:MAG: hypothetical protein JOZ34_06835, partial [Gammaproteobacteria bacterium]|nr:hypothetical protein [Gammaproteobacteria bacterium]